MKIGCYGAKCFTLFLKKNPRNPNISHKFPKAHLKYILQLIIHVVKFAISTQTYIMKIKCHDKLTDKIQHILIFLSGSLEKIDNGDRLYSGLNDKKKVKR